MKIKSLTLFIITCVSFKLAKPEDDYLSEVSGRCAKNKRAFSCAKYSALKYLSRHTFLAPETENRRSDSENVRLVRIQSPDNSSAIFSGSKQLPGDTEVTKIVKFLQRHVNAFFNGQGLAIPLPEGIEVLEDNSVEEIEVESGRQKKKKKDILIPLLILFKLFKIKVLVGTVLAGVIFIKKVILVAALILPTIIQSLKNHCKQSYHVVPHHVSEDYYHDTHDHETAPGYGYEMSHSPGYEKGWDRVNFGTTKKKYFKY